MYSVAVGLAVSVATLRDAVRSKLRSGATKDAVYLVILDHVPPEVRRVRLGTGISRQALELIPPERRADFLNALIEMPKAETPKAETPATRAWSNRASG
jgi:hypothetical protein